MNSPTPHLEPDPSFYKTLLESTQAIPWRIDWNTQQFSYIGPQIETLLGWPPSSWVTVDDWASRIHPEDRDRVVKFCVAQSLAGTDHEADYRALTKDGGYIWIRDVVHVARAQGRVEALVGFMFDISERKATEQKLLQLQKELEELSYKDGLTGVANRRRFDAAIKREWGHARRGNRPLSMILLDIDYFKEYNDCYGHLQGDDCLKQVAQALCTATRTRDLVARFGGEEFVVLLPDTDKDAAAEVAARCHTLIDEVAIVHERSPINARLTVSMGVATVVPEEENFQRFINLADSLLYTAKKHGRNRSVYG